MIKNDDKRACLVDGDPAIFHCWEQWSEVVGQSPMIGGHSAGQISAVYGICEFRSGKIKRVAISEIKFIDKIFNEYNFKSERGKERDQATKSMPTL